MWGCISVDSFYQPNFSTGFSSMKSDVIIHLAQWQYWWWFWFSFVWTLYFFFINRAVRTRVLKMRPKINTSYRSHGKWGDFLACIVPIIWCLNILTNSSFILRLMEWQNESSLFTVRIRGRQWYWVYKFELKHITDVLSAPRNIGNNQWVVSTAGSIEVTDNYFYAIKLRNQNVWLKNYWDGYVKNFVKYNNSTNDSYFEQAYKRSPLIQKLYTFKEFKEKFEYTLFEGGNHLEPFQFPSDTVLLREVLNETVPTGLSFFTEDTTVDELKLLEIVNKKILENKVAVQNGGVISWISTGLFLNNDDSPVTQLVKRGELADTNRFHKRLISTRQPIVISKAFLDLDKSESFKNKDYDTINVFFNKNKSMVKKVPNEQFFLTLKQKRYKRKKIIPQRVRFSKNADDFKIEKVKFSDRPCFVSTNFLDSINFEPTKLYRLLKKNKIRHEDMPVQLSRRLLRTKKTLVLPAHVNLTLITNSYDVVHSWFLPALGVKIDCVPGRSTHHVFYCDNVGFYYGQCAEICGRYHHHMPIRLCALPFEHFIIWWQHFGLNKVLLSYNKKRYDAKFINKTFSW